MMKYFRNPGLAHRMVIDLLSIAFVAVMFFYGPMSAMPLDLRIGTVVVLAALGIYMALRAPYVPDPAEAPAKKFFLLMVLGFVVGMGIVITLNWHFGAAVPMAAKIAVLAMSMLLALWYAMTHRVTVKKPADSTD